MDRRLSELRTQKSAEKRKSVVTIRGSFDDTNGIIENSIVNLKLSQNSNDFQVIDVSLELDSNVFPINLIHSY